MRVNFNSFFFTDEGPEATFNAVIVKIWCRNYTINKRPVTTTKRPVFILKTEVKIAGISNN